METIIDQIYRSGDDLLKYLDESKEVTLSLNANINFRKNMLLSVASYFEKEITDLVYDFTALKSNKNEMLMSIVKAKAISRQYHTYFDWEKPNNANKFFSLFGSSFKSKMEIVVKKDEALNTSIKAFLQLGSERNVLVHQNFAAISIEKTPKEIYEQYLLALNFIVYIKNDLLSDTEKPEEVSD